MANIDSNGDNATAAEGIQRDYDNGSKINGVKKRGESNGGTCRTFTSQNIFCRLQNYPYYCRTDRKMN